MWSDELHGGSDELQSRHVAKVFSRSMATDLRITIWFMLSEDTDPTAVKYGLVDSDLNPKPSPYAYQTAGQQLGTTRYVRTLASDEADSDQIEAYEFLTLNGLTRIIVAWTNDAASHPFALSREQVVVVDKFGQESTVRDGDDGSLDSVTEVDLGPSPVYLRIQP